MNRLPIAILALLITSAPASAQLRSGPAAGEAAPASLPAFAINGEGAGGPVDRAAERAGKPTVFLFVRADRLDRPMARFIRTLDQALAAGIEGAPEAAATAVWITEDVGASKEYLPRFQQSLKLEKTPLAVFEGGPLGPGGWDINDAAGLTAVVVRDGKVVRAIGYESLNETDVREVVQALQMSGGSRGASHPPDVSTFLGELADPIEGREGGRPRSTRLPSPGSSKDGSDSRTLPRVRLRFNHERKLP